MLYDLYIGNRLYFSWSLSAHLMIDHFGLDHVVKTHVLRPRDPAELRERLAGVAPSRTLPTLTTQDGAVINDSMAIAEELATRHPEIPFWPIDPVTRATARALANEMHSSFGGLRGDWPFNVRQHYARQTPPAPIAAELDRLEQIWTHARTVCSPKSGGAKSDGASCDGSLSDARGPWLCGDFSLVDAIFAPMAIRLAGYGFDTRPTTQTYVAAHLAHPSFRRWRAMALANEAVEDRFESDFQQVAWRGPAPRPAQAVAHGPSENDVCPYSGLPVTHFMEMDGRIFGFCNAFCRDKTQNDPDAWPKFTAMAAAL